MALTDIRERLRNDLAKVAARSSASALRRFLEGQQGHHVGRLLAPSASDKLDGGETVGAVFSWCENVCAIYREMRNFREQLEEDEPSEDDLSEFAREAAKAGRQFAAAITQLNLIRARSAALIAYYGHDTNWPEPISEGEAKATQDVLRRAIAWNELWVRRSTGHPTLPDAPTRREPGRPTDELVRSCEDLVAGLLSSAGLRQRQVAQYTFAFMQQAGLQPKSWQSIEQRLQKRRKRN